jgi:hypothetical protein
MLSVSYLFEGNLKRFVEKGNTNVSKINQAYTEKMRKADRVTQAKLWNARMKLQSRILKMPSSFT